MDIFIETFEKSCSVRARTSPAEVANKEFGHCCTGVRMWVKIRSRAISKSTFGIPLGVTPNFISMRETEIFCVQQKVIIWPHSRSSVPKDH